MTVEHPQGHLPPATASEQPEALPPVTAVAPEAQPLPVVAADQPVAPVLPVAQPEAAASGGDRLQADDDGGDDDDEDGDESDASDGDGGPPSDGRANAARRPRGPARGTPSDAPRENRFVDVVTGQFDADEEQADLPPPKRVLLPQAESPKLHKVLAQAGMGSRLEMEQLIMEGRITVNNEPAHIGQRIQFGDHVKVNGKPIKIRIDPPPPRVIAYHKPVGEVVTHDDPQNRPTVFRKLPKLFQGKWQSVGRLDLNTEGLLLFTSSGELANKLMHPRFGLEREYAVRVLGALTAEEKHKLLEGVRLDDGMGQFGSIEEGGGEGANCWYRVTISEGRHREVRRLMEAVGHAVSRLIRIRYGAMVLPRGLKRGAWVELDDGEIRALTQAADARGGRPREERADGRPEGQGGERGGDGQPRRNRSRGPRGRGNGQPQRGNGQPPQGAQQPPRDGGQGRSKNNRNEPRANKGQGGGDSQPDPMKTAFGYIGADSFTKQRQGPGGQRRGGGGGFGGGGGGFGGGQRRGGGGGGRGR